MRLNVVHFIVSENSPLKCHSLEREDRDTELWDNHLGTSVTSVSVLACRMLSLLLGKWVGQNGWARHVRCNYPQGRVKGTILLCVLCFLTCSVTLSSLPILSLG